MNEQRAAQQIVSSGCIRLDRLDPRVLGEFVDRATPVVTKDAAFEAFRKQSENWAKGVAYADTLELLDAKHRDVVIVHGCDNPDVNGIYVFKPVGTIAMYYKQDISVSMKDPLKSIDNRSGKTEIKVKKTNSPSAASDEGKIPAITSRKSDEDFILDGAEKEKLTGSKNAVFDNSTHASESDAKTEKMNNLSSGRPSPYQGDKQTAGDAKATENDEEDENSNVYTLEEDETDKTWYIKRGESDLLFKAPFEFPHHDFTKVPFDTWTVEDEDPDCTPPLVLFVPVASA